MNDITAKQNLFQQLVDQAVICSRQLESCLQTEFDVLSSRNPDALETLVTEKNTYLQKLNNILAEQASLLRALNLDMNNESVAKLYQNLPVGHTARKQWEKLQKLAKNLAELNLRNGILLSACEENTRNCLDILTGHRSEKPLYQYGGKAVAYREPGSLAHA